MKTIGVKATGIRCPIIKNGDDIVKVVTDSILASIQSGEFVPGDGDIVGVTESVVARAQGNYVSVDDVANEVKEKYGSDAEITVVNPIFSRNRFSLILKGLARGAKKINLVLGDPIDEVGNVCRNHPFTGLNYDEFYQEIIENEDCEVVFCRFRDLKPTTDNVLVASIHDRHEIANMFENKVFCLSDFCNKANGTHGYNEEYGLLGSNKATEDTLKLFPRDCEEIAYRIQASVFAQTQRSPHVLVYGDGAFKDPVGKIWELADPVVSPGHTEGLKGTPNEIKMKYMADTKFKDLDGEDAMNAMRNCIIEKEKSLVGNMAAQGTTPRQYTDLLGSLCDLVSGSGDKGTPVVIVQNYFDNYATE